MWGHQSQYAPPLHPDLLLATPTTEPSSPPQQPPAMANDTSRLFFSTTPHPVLIPSRGSDLVFDSEFLVTDLTFTFASARATTMLKDEQVVQHQLMQYPTLEELSIATACQDPPPDGDHIFLLLYDKVFLTHVKDAWVLNPIFRVFNTYFPGDEGSGWRKELFQAELELLIPVQSIFTTSEVDTRSVTSAPMVTDKLECRFWDPGLAKFRELSITRRFVHSLAAFHWDPGLAMGLREMVVTQSITYFHYATFHWLPVSSCVVTSP
jgi:hypothetical protein